MGRLFVRFGEATGDVWSRARTMAVMCAGVALGIGWLARLPVEPLAGMLALILLPVPASGLVLALSRGRASRVLLGYALGVSGAYGIGALAGISDLAASATPLAFCLACGLMGPTIEAGRTRTGR